MHTDYNDRNNPNKVPVKESVTARYFDNGDWWKLDDLRRLLSEGENEIRKHIQYDSLPAYIYLMVDDDYRVDLEFWGERMETDEEFESRQKQVKEQSITQKERELERFKHMASEHGFDLVKKIIE